MSGNLRNVASGRRAVALVMLAAAGLLVACGGGGSSGGIGGLTVSSRAASASSITLTWNRPDGYPAGSSFAIDLSTGGELARVSSTSYTVNNLDPQTQYCFVVRYFVLLGSRSSNTTCATTLADSGPPSVPSGLTANVVSVAEVDLAWNAATDDTRVDSYNVWRDDVLIGKVSRLAYDRAPAVPGATHCFSVSAVDAAGNESGRSASECVTLGQDLQDPTTPLDLTATFSDTSGTTTVELRWTASTDDGRIETYKIFRDGAFLAESPSPAFSDTGISAGTSYCYTVSAEDAAGKESPQSEPDCARAGWNRTSLGETAVYIDLAVDSSATPHFAYKFWYFNGNASATYYALEYINGSVAPFPRVNRLAEGPETFWFSDSGFVAVAVDSADNVHVAHKINRSPAPEIIEHWQLTTSLQTPATIEQTQERMNTIALDTDSSNVVHACYGRGGALYYADNSGGAWTPVDAATLAAGAAGSNCDIAIAADDSVHISFTETGSSDLMYLSNASGAWVLDAIEPNAGGVNSNYATSIAVDAAGAAHIAFFNDQADYDLEYATNASGSWVVSKPDSAGDVGAMPDIALDSSGAVHIVYLENAADTFVKYATNASGAWETGDLAAASGVDTAIAVDSSGFVHIAFADRDLELTYITNRP